MENNIFFVRLYEPLIIRKNQKIFFLILIYGRYMLYHRLIINY